MCSCKLQFLFGIHSKYAVKDMYKNVSIGMFIIALFIIIKFQMA